MCSSIRPGVPTSLPSGDTTCPPRRTEWSTLPIRSDELPCTQARHGTGHAGCARRSGPGCQHHYPPGILPAHQEERNGRRSLSDLMSCRVLKRDMELAMLDVLVDQARDANITTLRGYYLPTKKNGMVADHY